MSVWGVKTLRTQDTSDPRHFGTGAEVSVRQFGTSAELSERHFGTKEDTSAPLQKCWALSWIHKQLAGICDHRIHAGLSSDVRTCNWQAQCELRLDTPINARVKCKTEVQKIWKMTLMSSYKKAIWYLSLVKIWHIITSHNLKTVQDRK